MGKRTRSNAIACEEKQDTRELIQNSWNDYSPDNPYPFEGNNGRNAELRIAFELSLDPNGDRKAHDLTLADGRSGEIKKVESHGHISWRIRLSSDGVEGVYGLYADLLCAVRHVDLFRGYNELSEETLHSMKRGNFSTKNVFSKGGLCEMLAEVDASKPTIKKYFGEHLYLSREWDKILPSKLITTDLLIIGFSSGFYVMTSDIYDEAFELDSIRQSRPTLRFKKKFVEKRIKRR